MAVEGPARSAKSGQPRAYAAHSAACLLRWKLGCGGRQLQWPDRRRRRLCCRERRAVQGCHGGVLLCLLLLHVLLVVPPLRLLHLLGRLLQLLLLIGGRGRSMRLAGTLLGWLALTLNLDRLCNGAALATALPPLPAARPAARRL